MDTVVLRSFVAIAEHGSFTEAASRLGASQSTISGHVARLEDHFQTALFHRTTRRCTLSAVGEALLPMALDALRAVERIEDTFRPSTMGGSIRLGVPDDYHLFTHLSTAIQSFQKARPLVSIQVESGLSANHVKALSNGLLDLAILREARPLGHAASPPARLVWIASPDLAIEPEATLPIAHISGPCMYFRAATTALSEAGLKWRSVFSCSALEGVRTVVRHGLAVAAVLEEDCPDPAFVLRAPWLPPLPQFSVTFQSAQQDPPVLVRTLAKEISEALRVSCAPVAAHDGVAQPGTA